MALTSQYFCKCLWSTVYLYAVLLSSFAGTFIHILISYIYYILYSYIVFTYANVLQMYLIMHKQIYAGNNTIPRQRKLGGRPRHTGVPFCTMRQSFDIGAAPKVKRRWWIDLDSRLNSVCSNWPGMKFKLCTISCFFWIFCLPGKKSATEDPQLQVCLQPWPATDQVCLWF